MTLRPENPRCPFQQLPTPRRDLVLVNVELLRQLVQRLLALHDSQRQLRLEGRAVVPACSLRHQITCSVAMLAAFRQKLHLAACADLPNHLSTSLGMPQISRFGRGDRIRTCDPLVPNQMRYQAALRPDFQ